MRARPDTAGGAVHAGRRARGRPAAPTRRSSSSATPSRASRTTPTRFYMIGTVLKQQGALDEAIAQFRKRDQVPAAVRRGASQPRPGAEPAGRHGQAAAAELAEADRLNRRTADAQASTFAVSVGVQKAEGGRLPRRHRAVPRGHPPRRRQPAGALSARARAAPHRRAGRSAMRTSPTAHRLAPYLGRPATTSHDRRRRAVPARARRRWRASRRPSRARRARADRAGRSRRCAAASRSRTRRARPG